LALPSQGDWWSSPTQIEVAEFGLLWRGGQAAGNEQVMKERESDKMRPNYDFSAGIRGKYVQRLAKGANVVVLDRDVAKIFPTSKAVNDALRVLAAAGKRHSKAKGGRRSA
jgi:hypothetical protein